MDYKALRLERPFEVDEVVSVHYFEYASNYCYEGEQHDFWEFLYVDKGELHVRAGSRELTMKRGQMIFHEPGEFHSLRANGVVAPNLVVMSFVCRSPAMARFAGRVLAIGDAEREYLARIIKEAAEAFSTPLNDPYTKQLLRAPHAPFGAEQLIGASLESLLVCLARRGQGGAAQSTAKPTSLIRAHSQQEFVDRVRAYLEKNISRKLTLADICRDNLVGRSYLQKVFREKTGGGAMEYFGSMKIEKAQELIREGRHNFTEISALLGYTSIHYFSRHFKKVTGMTPSEYASSVKGLAGHRSEGKYSASRTHNVFNEASSNSDESKTSALYYFPPTIKHFGLNLKSPKENHHICRKTYAKISTKSSFVSGETYSDDWCKRHYELCMQNFDLNMEYFKSLSHSEFNSAIDSFVHRFPQFHFIDNLREYKDKSGYYMMILDDFCQSYIGTTKNIYRRIYQHWAKNFPFDRLIFGEVSTSKLSINSFKALDTTRILVALSSDIYVDENNFIEAFPTKFLLNRISGGAKESFEDAIHSPIEHSLEHSLD